MEKIKCFACGNELSSNICERCGYPKIMIMINSQDAKEKHRMKAFAYRQKILGNIAVSTNLVLYEDETVVKGKEEIIWKSVEKNEVGRVYWNERRFARTSGKENVELEFFITRGNEKKEHVIKLVTVETEPQLWQVGIVLEPGLYLKVALGTQDNYALSEAISLK